ncbi:MAG: xanthine dehydrogenase family protein molybdopterin-binding subunit [Spirochaetia bacterium]|jgi:CO/xanthine dehydrogenase Mo-binding subunit|nr:xanthine dehydrogenase family protein molybdopterin-binding subunit [Spirochaetia bacterium]
MSSKNTAYRNDSVSKVTGRAYYVDDFRFYNEARCIPVYSGYVHAKLNNINYTDAENYPGVIKVITWKDVPGQIKSGQIFQDYSILVKDKIRYEGDVVALVVAETEEAALQGAQLISLDVDELPVILDSFEAMQEGTPLIHDEFNNNIICHHKVRRGDVDKAFNECDVIVERDFHTPFVEHAFLETEGSICIPKRNGGIEVYGSMQHPFSTRRFVSAHLGLPISQIEVFSHPVGGSFGGKDDTAAMVCARTALAACLINRPVRMIYTREWSMMEGYKRVPYDIKYKYGLTKDGYIKAVNCYILANSGAIASTTPWLTWRSTAQSCGPYMVPNVNTDVYGVATNNGFTGAFRGFGAPQSNFAIEQMMDICAEKLDIDPITFRKQNGVIDGSTTITGQVLNTHKVSLHQVIDTVIDASGYREKMGKNSHGKGDSVSFYGIGLASSYRGSSIGAEGMDFASCTVNCQFDGSIVLSTGIFENGQGAESAMNIMLADLLGVKLERIFYTTPSTSNIPDSGTTVASRGTLMGGGAIKDAVIKLKDIMTQNLSDKLRCLPREVVFKDDHLWGRDGYKLPWDEAVRILHTRKVFPFAFGYFQAPSVTWDEETGQGDAYFTYVYSSQVAEVEVDKKSGKVKVLKVTAAHDIGKAINKDMVEGQIFGGIVQGMGMALIEDLTMIDGHVQQLNLNKYKIPKSTDMPDMEAIIIENQDPNSPTGAKGIGEPALEIIAPAIANAVYNATGYRSYSMPIKVPILEGSNT